MHPAGEWILEQWPEESAESAEQRLVRAVLNGDHAAFDALVRQHSAQVTSVVRRVSSEPNEVEDIVQETFLRAYQHLRRFRGRSQLRTWLIQIAVNVCRDRQRSFWKRRVRLSLPEGADPAQAGFADAAVLQQSIAAAVAKLPEKLRLPFVLHAFEELSGLEIAAVLGCRESTVWTRIYAARKQLRGSLADLLD
jgi:RNA polymerase sigma-70 factor (ECF subfamily)